MGTVPLEEGSCPPDRPPRAARAFPIEPFLWTGGEVGCLLVHGFTGTPYDMRFIGERLNAAGHTVHAVRLAGHGTRAQDLATCRWQDWYRSVEDGLDQLARHCRTTVAIGQSLGSLLGLRLAHQRGQAVSALVLLSSALVVANPWPARLTWVLRGLIPFLPSRCAYVGKLGGGSDIADPEARRVHPGYTTMPLRAIVEVLRLQREVRSLLREVGQPVLAIHARQDHTAPLANLSLLQRTLPHLRAAVVLDASYHVMTVDVEKQRVAEEILRFLRLAGGPGRVEGR